MPADIDQIIKKSQESCASTGAKLTSKRKNVLTVLLTSSTPLSAYEVVERYKKQFNESLPVMSVYRMLDFLIQEKLVHKLETAGQYVTCAHIACDHQHEPDRVVGPSRDADLDATDQKHRVQDLRQAGHQPPRRHQGHDRVQHR